MTPSIEVDNLSLRYGETTALDNLSFRLDGGQIYGLLGRNGAGKSSLLAVLAAFRQATAGAVRIDGQPVFENPTVTRQICLIRETGDTVAGDESVETALSFAAEMRPHWDAGYAAKLVERFQLSPRQKVGELSKGK
ncbi:MAG: ATP-binding cassette domain-containing protein [Thermomicrobiales bacterium]